MDKLKQWLFLSEKGWTDLKHAIRACTFSSLSLMLPFMVTVQVFIEVLKPLSGGEISWTHLWVLFGIGVISFFIVFALFRYDYGKTYVAAYSQSEKTRLGVAGHLRKLPLSFFNRKDLSELSTNMMGDCTNIEGMMTSVIPQIAANIISSTIVCVLLAFFDWRLALAVLITLPFALAVMWFSRKLQNRSFERHVDAKLKATAQTQEYLEGIKVIKSYGEGGTRFAQLKQALDDMRQAAIKVQVVSSAFISVSTVLLQAGVGLTVFVGTFLITKGQVDFVTLLMFLLIAVRIYGPIVTSLTMLPDLLYVSVSSRRLHELMDSPVMEGNENMDTASDTIEFEGVGFSYDDAEVIHDFSARVQAGSITAIVGPSGSGKSTLSRLAARFWDVQEGRVSVGGIDVKQIAPEKLMESMSFVFQEVLLFDDTVFNNIRIGRADSSDAEVYAAARAAQCEEFIEALPQGYDTLLGENGNALSGGQRQRISIARALLKNAPILFLDEATASLDPESEMQVQTALSHLIQGKTVLVIAHRLRTITEADTILVLDKGRLVEQGSHEELRAQGGWYARMIEEQQKAQGWVV